VRKLTDLLTIRCWLIPLFCPGRFRALIRVSRFAFASSYCFCIVGYDIFDIYCLFLVGGFTLGVFILGVTFVERFRVVEGRGDDWMDGWKGG